MHFSRGLSKPAGTGAGQYCSRPSLVTRFNPCEIAYFSVESGVRTCEAHPTSARAPTRTARFLVAVDRLCMAISAFVGRSKRGQRELTPPNKRLVFTVHACH